MYTERYNYVEHHNYIRQLYIQRHIDPLNVKDLPKTGVCVFERGELIAFAALRMIEGGLALLESLITNPDAPGDLRHTCIDNAVKHLTDYADNNHIRSIIAWSTDENTLLRSDKHGFVRVPKHLIARPNNLR